MAKEIAHLSDIRVRRPYREFLLQIRRGKFTYAELIAEAEKLVGQVAAAFAASALPPMPDTDAAEATLRRVRRAFYAARPEIGA